MDDKQLILDIRMSAEMIREYMLFGRSELPPITDEERTKLTEALPVLQRIEKELEK